MKIIALTGLAGCGKSTVASVLAEYGFGRVRFADPLKTMLRALGLGDAEIEGPLKERPCHLLAGRTPRHAMQTLGTEWGRSCIGPDFWVGLWQRTACAVLDHGGRVAAEDCRFPNEAAAARALGGEVWLVLRPGLAVGGHASEQAGQDIVPDRIIRNDGTLADLRRAVERCLTYGENHHA